MNVNEYLEATRDERGTHGYKYLRVRPAIVCGDGLRLSVQASDTYYSEPRDVYGPYSAVEVGFPSMEIPEIMEWAESPATPLQTVYGWVPVEVVDAVIVAHGGIVNAPQPVQP